MTDEIKNIAEDNLISDKRINNYVRHLEAQIKEKDEQIFLLKEKIEEKNNEIKSYDMLMGYTSEMSIRDKKRLNQKCDKEEKKIQDIVKDLDPVLQEEYEQDLADESDIVDLALEQNQLQFEISEAFQSIKQNLKNNDTSLYDKYKQYKRDFYKIMEGFFNIVSDDFKPRLFDVIEEIITKQGAVYEIDEKIKLF